MLFASYKMTKLTGITKLQKWATYTKTLISPSRPHHLRRAKFRFFDRVRQNTNQRLYSSPIPIGYQTPSIIQTFLVALVILFLLEFGKVQQCMECTYRSF